MNMQRREFGSETFATFEKMDDFDRKASAMQELKSG
jgi:hypothetical protein